ncbi:MAG: hypothetical protein KAU99_03195, partial [Thermoplasmata archaeon]|nr:hypothetical protein [Thermoplasmata archaeon]
VVFPSSLAFEQRGEKMGKEVEIRPSLWEMLELIAEQEDDGEGQVRTKVHTYPGIPPHRTSMREEQSSD